MRENYNTAIYGENAILIPYRREHVEKYHGWMQSDELLEKTASEKLTLEQEYEMQQKWYQDEDKCTFIILAQSLWKKTKNEVDSMVGDVNFFLKEDRAEAEVEIMVAEKFARNQGIGTESVLAMLLYGIKFLHISKFLAVIGNENQDSVHLFAKFGFTKVKETPIFNECTFMLDTKIHLLQNEFGGDLSKLKFVSYPIEEN